MRRLLKLFNLMEINSVPELPKLPPYDSRSFMKMKGFLPVDNSLQFDAYEMAKKTIYSLKPRRILDAGCGDGHSENFFLQCSPESQWLGLDITESDEAKLRKNGNPKIIEFDGREFPFDDQQFDLVFSRQVLEHVENPSLHLREIHRVLRKGGIVVGSTSVLEPFHSDSFWCFTPLGLHRVLSDSGLELQEIRPGIDSLTLIRRSMTGEKALNRYFSEESPNNIALEAMLEKQNASVQLRNWIKAIYSGHLVFSAVKN